jgi:hypothetical protein
MRMESKQSKTLMLNSISPLVPAGHAPAVDKFYSEVTIWHDLFRTGLLYSTHRPDFSAPQFFWLDVSRELNGQEAKL